MRDKLGSSFCCRVIIGHFSIGLYSRTLLSVNHHESEQVLNLFIHQFKHLASVGGKMELDASEELTWPVWLLPGYKVELSGQMVS